MRKNIPEDSPIEFYFNTVDSTGAPVAPSSAFAASDFSIHKDGSASEKASENGITVTSPFDSKTGLHLISIDTSNDTGDSGFWVAGGRYAIRFETAKTVDSISIDGRMVPNAEFVIDAPVSVASVTGGINTGAGVITTLDGLDTAQDTQHSTTQSAVSGLNDFDPAADTVAHVTLVDTTTTNTDLVSAAAIRAEIDSNSTQLAAIVADTNELQTNQGNWVTATGFSTLDAAGVRASVGLATANLDTQLTAIVGDTNELQTNQGNWLTATGFSTFDASTDTVDIGKIKGTALTETTGGNLAANISFFYDLDVTTTNTVNDVGGDATSANQTTIINAITALNDFDPAADIVAHVTLVDTTTTNTDMRGTDSAFLAASAPANFSDLAVTATTGKVTVGTNDDKTGYAISGTLTTLDALDTAQDTQHTTTQSAISGLNDLSAADVNAEVDTALTDYDGPTSTEMVAAFTEIKGATWATTDTLEAIRDRGDSAWATATGFSTHSAADVRTEIDANSTQLAAIVTVTGTTIPAQITALNNVSAADIINYDMGDSRTVLQALAFLRNKWVINSGILTVYQTDDATESWNAAITQTAGNPVSSVDPA